MQLSDCLWIFFKCCQVFGIMPYSRISGTFKWIQSRPNEIITISFLVANIFNFLLVFIFPSEIIFFTQMSTISVLNIYVIIIFVGHVFVFLIETLFKRTHHIQLLNIFEELESYAKHFQDVKFNYKNIRFASHRVLFYWTVHSFVTFGLQVYTSKERKDLYIALFCALPHLLSMLSFFFWIVLVAILNENLNALVKYTKLLCVNTGEMQSPFNVTEWKNKTLRGGRINKSTLQFISQFYCLIWDASNLINHIVLWSFPIELLSEFTFVVWNFFNFIRVTSNLSLFSNLSIVQGTLSACVSIINVTLLTSTCEKTKKAVSILSRTTCELLKLMRDCFQF